MYKFLVLGVVLSVISSDVMGMVWMNDPRLITDLHDTEESDMSEYYADDYADDLRRFMIINPRMPTSSEFEAESGPENRLEDEPENESEYEPAEEPEEESKDEPEDESEDEPEAEPENQPEDNPEDKSHNQPEATLSEDTLKNLENKLGNIVEKLDNLIKVTTKNRLENSSGSTTNMIKELSSEYLVTKGIGAHKLHLRRLTWNQARKVCIDEGGQLADIRSDSEEKILLERLFEENVEFAWVGYHDIFEEGEWISVLGEPLGKSGWDRWWKRRLPNPDNDGGEENCACLMRDGGGMNDNNCSKELSFICKITAF